MCVSRRDHAAGLFRGLPVESETMPEKEGASAEDPPPEEKGQPPDDEDDEHLFVERDPTGRYGRVRCLEEAIGTPVDSYWAVNGPLLDLPELPSPSIPTCREAFGFLRRPWCLVWAPAVTFWSHARGPGPPSAGRESRFRTRAPEGLHSRGIAAAVSCGCAVRYHSREGRLQDSVSCLTAL